MNREQAKKQRQKGFARLADRSAGRVDALLHAITVAQLSTDLEVGSLRSVLIAEYESHLYHQARADGAEHQAALGKSREGRKQVDALAGWA
jgi:hypothetical protein